MMSSSLPILLPIVFVVAGVIAFVAYKKSGNGWIIFNIKIEIEKIPKVD